MWHHVTTIKTCGLCMVDAHCGAGDATMLIRDDNFTEEERVENGEPEL